MLRNSRRIAAIGIVGVCLAGCTYTAGTPAESAYPAVPAACFCETDPKVTMPPGNIGKVRPLPVKQVLVIPVYKNYAQDGALYLSIAHPFVCRQGDDVEKALADFGRREHLHKLVC
jgi:hypothetical protein